MSIFFSIAPETAENSGSQKLKSRKRKTGLKDILLININIEELEVVYGQTTSELKKWKKWNKS